jgi:hypothetical protein
MGRGDEGLNEARAHIGSYFSYEPRGDIAGGWGAKTHLLRISPNEFGQEFDHVRVGAGDCAARRGQLFLRPSALINLARILRYAAWPACPRIRDKIVDGKVDINVE